MSQPTAQEIFSQYLQPMPPAALVAAVALDPTELRRLVRLEQASRGLNAAGEWVGFTQAAALAVRGE